MTEIQKEMEKYCEQFAMDYGEIILLRANIAAINKLLIDNGKEEKLFKAIKHIIEKYKRDNSFDVEINNEK